MSIDGDLLIGSFAHFVIFSQQERAINNIKEEISSLETSSQYRAFRLIGSVDKPFILEQRSGIDYILI